MKLPYRKPITSLSEEQLGFILSSRFGKDVSSVGGFVGPGWNDIIYDLNKKLEAEKPDYQIFQIKEKFGTLRFYYSGGDDYIRGLESMAASMTSRICEQCGCPGTSRSTKKQRWVLVLCDKHAEEQGYIEDES
jgi:hypothetical protein